MKGHPYLAIVTWNDAQGSATQVYEEARDHAPVVMTLVGWVLARDRKGLSLANEHWTEDGKQHYRGHTFVPRGMVVSVKKIKDGTK